MAKTPKNATTASTVSPDVSGVKRGRFIDEEDVARRVSPREQMTQEENDDHEGVSLMENIILSKLWSDSEQVLEGSLIELFMAVFDEDDEKLEKNQTNFYQLGGQQTIVRVMTEHLNSKGVQKHAIVVLMNASYNNDALRTAIAKVRGIQAILAAMKKYSTERDVVAYGFGALSNLVDENEANAELLVKHPDTIPFLIMLMNSYLGDEEVAESACELLKHLGSFENLRKQIVASKVRTSLAFAMDKHGDHGKVQEYAGAALKLLL